MPWLPGDFEVPRLVETARFRLRPLSIHDLVKDYDAVMTSREHLWGLFGEAWGWPAESLTLEEDLVHLGWHQMEFERRSSFNFAVMSPDESRLLGCVYVDPPTKEGFDTEVFLWARPTEPGLEDELHEFARGWIADEWPFERVAWPGRDHPWPEFDALADLDR